MLSYFRFSNERQANGLCLLIQVDKTAQGSNSMKKESGAAAWPEPGMGTDAARMRAARIRLLLMDCDGVLTDGKMYYFPDSSGKAVEFKGFNSHDGLGFHILNRHGIKSGVISGLDSPALTERARILKIAYVYQGRLSKEGAWHEILGHAKVTEEETAFIGDDFSDVPLLRRAGLACAVANARDEVKMTCHFVTKARGGEGAVREVVELILKSQGLWPDVLAHFNCLPLSV